MDLGLIDGIGSENEALKYLEINYPTLEELKIIDIENSSDKPFFFQEIFNKITTSDLNFFLDSSNSLKLMSIARWKFF